MISENSKLESAEIGFTVAIPTYNGGDRLPKVLERLRSQVNTNFSWEILVVDNNSSDNTKEVVQSYQADWQGPTLRYCFEAKQGLAFARQCAVENAHGEFVGLLPPMNLVENIPRQALLVGKFTATLK
jgi:glycosyltransferase involved in cell wall biosynthesis